MENKEIEELWLQAKIELFESNWIFEKASFECLIDGMIFKIQKKYNKGWGVNKTPQDDDIMSKLESMKYFLDRLSYKNCIFHFQSKIIISQENRILKLELDKDSLIEELKELKSNIK